VKRGDPFGEEGKLGDDIVAIERDAGFGSGRGGMTMFSGELDNNDLI